MDTTITSCKCGQALTPPEQLLLSQNKPVYCRRCGIDILAMLNDLLHIATTPINTDDILCKPEISFCLSCPFFQYGICTNINAIILVNNKEVSLTGKSIKDLPKDGCKNGKD